ncbi:hypothetical protein KKF23_01680 [Patescibacteria group bacterium]|nr:hypothetical protein [Patescibacteria group bacterium]
MNPEKNILTAIETETKKERPTAILLDIYETKERGEISKIQGTLSTALEELNHLASSNGKQKLQENLDWLLNNNNRIDLYQITAVLNGENYNRADEEMGEAKAKQLFAYQKIQAALSVAGEISQPNSVQLIADFIDINHENVYLCNTAIDSLGKNKSPEARNKMLKIADEQKYGYELRTRAVLTGLRAGIPFEGEKISTLLKQYMTDSGDKICQTMGTYNIIEIAGLLADHHLSAEILDNLQNRIQNFPPEKTQWFERDIVSTRLAVQTGDKERYLEKTLSARHYTAKNGIVFGSIKPDFNFAEFLDRHRDKFDKMAGVLEHLNQAFSAEPIMYVDISSGDANEAGWTQNSIYFSSDYIEHSHEIGDLLQSTGHEACERWQSKGFIDVQLSKYYLQLMGQKYQGSQLDKFRLKHRMKDETNAGHPWDGEREFIAELGSTLLVDPTVSDKLFDPTKDQTALEALNYLKTKLNLKT